VKPSLNFFDRFAVFVLPSFAYPSVAPPSLLSKSILLAPLSSKRKANSKIELWDKHRAEAHI